MRAAAEDGSPASVEIHDEIGAWGVSAKSFIADFRALDGGGKTIEVHLNTPGGEVFDGLAIANAIEPARAKTVGIVDGLAASMGSVIFMACSERVMPENSFLMVHNPSSFAWGEAKDLRKTADLLDTIRTQMVGYYAKRTGRSEAEIGEMMDSTTWMSGLDAAAFGFATAVSDPVSVKACVKPEMAGKMGEIPEAAKALLITAQEDSGDEPTDPAVEPADAHDAEPAPSVTPDAKELAAADPVVAALQSGADEAPVTTARPVAAGPGKRASAPWNARIAEMNSRFGRI
ncbi:head maturation protease, ClpP-related [Cereibacter sphaeroides f. sp. denitrificans]|nr:Clp protease ClpP [Cereibacter sphaeroides f. sp. denitrificans]